MMARACPGHLEPAVVSLPVNDWDQISVAMRSPETHARRVTQTGTWRLEIAQRVANAYALNAHVDAVFVSASTARGQSDRYSDIELGVFWAADPTKAERAAAIDAAGGDLHLLYEPDGIYWEDAFFAGSDAAGTLHSGQFVEISHIRTHVIQDILDRLDTEPDPDVIMLLAGIDDAVPFHSNERVKGWQKTVRRYPDELARAVVRRHGQIEFFWRWQMLVARGAHPAPIHAHFWSVQQHLLQLLLAINRRYRVGYKFLDTIVERCPIAPTSLGERFDSISTQPAAHAAAELHALVLETYDLIEVHVPGLDPCEVDQWRTWFNYQRPFWDGPPDRAMPTARG